MKNKIYKRTLVNQIVKFLKRSDIIVLLGARQVGKTTLLKYLITNHIKKNVFYFDLENIKLLQLCNSGTENTYRYLLEQGANEKEKITLVIDEIQYLNNPSSFLKIFHDHYKNVKLIVSGSSTFDIKKKFNESLAGRTVTFELFPLSFEEFLLFKNKSYKLSTNNSQTTNDELINLAEEYIKYGGYPKVVLEKSVEVKQVYLSQIINTYIRKDIRDIGNIRNIEAFNNLLELLGSQSGSLLNILELSNTLNLNRNTVETYLYLLENTFIIKRIRPFHKNLRTEISKHPKIYFLDTGMMHLLWLKDFPKVIFGNSFETFVFLELLKSKKEVKFWRTTNKQEVDFIFQGKKLHSIEVKLNFNHAKLKSLNFFSHKYNSVKTVIGLYGKKQGKYIWEFIKDKYL